MVLKIRYVVLMNNIDSHSMECAIYNVYKHRVLRLRSTDWRSALKPSLPAGSFKQPIRSRNVNTNMENIIDRELFSGVSTKH